MKHFSKKTSIIFISSILLAIFIVVGYFSYAFVTADVVGNETSKKLSGLSQVLKIKYDGGNETLITTQDGYFYPGTIIEKNFSVTNVGDFYLNYSINLKNVINEFERVYDLTYELYLDDVLLISDFFPVYDSVIAYNQTIDKNETKNYTLKLIYSNSDENQIIDQNKLVSADIDFEQTKNSISNIKLLGNSVQGRVPQEYEEVEYIQSTGTQYIDTGIVGNENTGFDITFSTSNSLGTTDFGAIFGARKKSSENEIQLTTFHAESSGFSGTFRFGNSSYNAGLTSGSKINFKLINKTITRHDGSLETLTGSFTTPSTITIFALNQNGSITQYGSVKLYSFKIYDGNNLIRDYIPVYRKSDNVIGFWPLQNNPNISISNQTYTDLEIILVNDGSKDNSGNICDRYAEKDSRIKVIHKENGGVSSARNIGLDFATGEYIGFVDGDDLLDARMFEVLLTNAEQHNCDISCCQLVTIDVDGTKHPTYNVDSKFLDKNYIIENYFFDAFIKDTMYGCYNKLFKRDLISKQRFKNYKYGEDILFVFDAITKSKIINYTNYEGYYYIHRHNSAMTSSFSGKRLDYIDAIREIEEMCKREYDFAYEYAKCWVYQHVLITARQIIGNRKQKEFKNWLAKEKRYLKSNAKTCLSKLARKRVLDYLGVMYFPIYFFVLSNVKRR